MKIPKPFVKKKLFYLWTVIEPIERFKSLSGRCNILLVKMLLQMLLFLVGAYLHH